MAAREAGPFRVACKLVERSRKFITVARFILRLRRLSRLEIEEKEKLPPTKDVQTYVCAYARYEIKPKSSVIPINGRIRYDSKLRNFIDEIEDKCLGSFVQFLFYLYLN